MRKYDDKVNGKQEFNEKVYGIRDIKFVTGSKKVFIL
jgi:hypothetical protein